MNKVIYPLLSFILMVILLISCEKEIPIEEKPVDNKITLTDGQLINYETNRWIYEEMDINYLWTQHMPRFRDTTSTPQEFFNNLLYEKDKWSHLAQDYKTWINSLRGITKSHGHSIELRWEDQSKTSLVGYVQFVYENSPSARAGIKRGNVIAMVNGQDITYNNYYKLLFETMESTFRLGRYNENGSVNLADTTVTVSAEEIQENPVIYSKVFEENDKKIGYLVYVGYISGFNDELNKVLSFFKSSNVDDVVLDLRYNPGGDLGAAVELCSSLAPNEVIKNEEILVKYQWNSENQNYLNFKAKEDPEYYDYLRILFDGDVKNNLDLSRIFILTTEGTASASELTITGLDPYMKVVTIGETTHGKYAASITIPDKDSLWAIQPIVLKYANANNVSDFVNGFTPDYEIQDVLIYEFGDIIDPMLSKAMELITGNSEFTKSERMEDRWRGDKIDIVGRHKRIQEGVLDVTEEMLDFNILR